MIHFAVFGYMFVIMVGIVCLTIAFILYRKIRSKLLYHFLVYFSAFTLFIFFYLLVLTYINANNTQVGFHFIVTILAIIVISFSFFIYSILHFGHFLTNKKLSKKRTVFEILISLIFFVSIVSSFSIDWDHHQVDQQINVGVILSYSILFSVIIYNLLLKRLNRKNVAMDRKQIYKRTSILNFIFIPGFILDFYLIKTLSFSLFIPLFYFSYSIVFLQAFIKMYHVDSISETSPEEINDLNDYLNLAGISVREKEVVTLIMKGYSNQKISNQLFISLSTVKTHVRNIFQKLNVESRFEIMSRINKRQQN